MAVADLDVVLKSQGNGTNKIFPLGFAFQEVGHIKVYRRDETNPLLPVETLLVEGALQDYVLTGANPPSVPLPTAVTFNTAPTALQKIFVVRELPLDQPLELQESAMPKLKSLEKEYDRIVMQVQQLGAVQARTLKFSLTAPVADTTFPTPVAGAESFLGFDANGKIQLITAEELGGGFGKLGVPTDGGYGSGTTAGPVTGVDAGDSLEDAFDKIENLAEKLAPAKPANLSTLPLSIGGSYSAIESGSGLARPVVIDSANPQIITPAGTPFGDGAAGILTALLDSSPAGSIVLTAASDVGSNGALEITSDADIYAGVAGKEGFWFGLRARINATLLALGVHTATLTHSKTGSTTLTFGVDDPGTPTVTGPTVTASGAARYVSGVPTLSVGDTITAGFTVGNAVRTHYSASGVASASSPQTNSVSLALPGVPYASGQSVAASLALAVSSNAYSENVSVTLIGRNAKNGTASLSASGNIRVDTTSSEAARSKSGTGQYPTKGSGAAQFGDAYNSSDLLTANKELQLVNGTYGYPALNNYTANVPVSGPNYTGLTPDAYNNDRWATFNVGSKTNATSLVLNFSGASGFGSTALVSGLDIYVLIDGATGWVNANAAYPGTGNPSANGDPALDVGASTSTSKRVTFGSTPRTGNVWVRVGIPSGSAKRFASIGMV